MFLILIVIAFAFHAAKTVPKYIVLDYQSFSENAKCPISDTLHEIGHLKCTEMIVANDMNGLKMMSKA